MTLKSTISADLEALDKAFLDVLSNLKAEVTKSASHASETILERASSYMAEGARNALVNFHKLYFGGPEGQAGFDDVNKNVDDLFDQAQKALGSGTDASAVKLTEDDAKITARLSLSGAQKELEAVIRMDQGIREKLVPILSNLQFEDALQQRLSHIIEAWTIMTTQLRAPEDLDIEITSLEMAALTTSIDERDLFYKIVVKAPPPPDAHVNDIVLFDL